MGFTFQYPVLEGKTLIVGHKSLICDFNTTLEFIQQVVGDSFCTSSYEDIIKVHQAYF